MVKITILLADDHSVLLEGLAAVLTQDGFDVVGLAGNAGLALQLYRERKPDLALIDLRMPPAGGFEFLRAVRAEYAGAKVVFFSTFAHSEDVARAHKEGACGYLVKDIPREDLVRCLREVHQGARWITPGSRQPHKELRLTRRERQVLELLAAGQANKTIGDALAITEGTVKLHAYNLYKKLGVSSRTEALLAAQDLGLLGKG